MIFVFLSSAIKVVTEYERSVFFRLGHVRPEAKGPGVIFRFPIVDRVVKVNLRVEVVDIPPQAVITKDNVTIQVDAVVYFQVVEPVRAIIGVDNFRFASQRIAMTSLRSIIGRYELDSLLAHREDVNSELRTVIARRTTEWGVEVRQVEVRDITLPAGAAPGHGPPGRGRAGAAGQGHRRHRRAPGQLGAGRGGRPSSDRQSPARCSCGPCRPWPRWRPSTTRRSCSRSPIELLAGLHHHGSRRR